MRRLPSLPALRAFEAAARHLSFTNAAEELHVSQAAVSRHVRSLEASLGRMLFRRLHRRVELTPAGAHLAGELTAGFLRIRRAVEVASGIVPRRLRLTVEPAFGSGWLVPRLARFASAHPDIELTIETSDEVRLLPRDADIAIRYLAAGSRRKGLKGRPLFAIAGIPVVAALAPRSRDFDYDSAVLGRKLLHDDDGETWRRWFAAAGLDGFERAAHQYFTDHSLAVAAAQQGQGVALGATAFVESELRSGRLLQLGRTRLPFGSYWLLEARDRSTAALRGAFVRWLATEISTLAALGAGAP